MKKLSLTALLAGAALFTVLGTTTLSAKCGDAETATKCGGEKKAAAKCGGEMTPPKANSRCGADMTPPKANSRCGGEKKAPAAPKAAEKCGVGKCG